jgi:Bacterial Ig-like domain (group 3)
MAQTMVTAVNGLTSPATPVVITMVLGVGTYTGITASPKLNITLDLAGTSGTVIKGASPALTVTAGDVFAAGMTLTNDTDAPTILVTGGHLTLGQVTIQESTGFNNVALAVTGGHVDLGFDIVMNINGQGGFVRSYDLDAVGFSQDNDADLTPNTYSVNGVPVSATHLSATSLTSSVAPSVYAEPVTFTAGIDVEADDAGPATGTVTFYDGAATLGSGTLSEVGPDVFVATFTTSSLSVGTHTITAVYGGNDVYIASSAVVTQLVNAYSFTGFFQPVDNPPTLNQVNAGQSISIKFSLGGNFGLNIIAAGYPTSQQISCSSTAPVDVIEETTTANQGLTYGGGQYNYVWKTQKSWAGTCRQFTMRLADSTDHLALFKFK